LILTALCCSAFARTSLEQRHIKPQTHTPKTVQNTLFGCLKHCT